MTVPHELASLRKLIDDSDLRFVHPPRRESIGARSDPYGPARVNVYDAAGLPAGSWIVPGGTGFSTSNAVLVDTAGNTYVRTRTCPGPQASLRSSAWESTAPIASARS